MMKRNEFIEYIIGDQLGELTGLSARAMFGGYGIYLEGTIVGIVVDDQLFLKVDESNITQYQQMRSVPFTYQRKDGKSTTMSYWKVPDEAMEDRDILRDLVLASYEISLKHAVTKQVKRNNK